MAKRLGFVLTLALAASTTVLFYQLRAPTVAAHDFIGIFKGTDIVPPTPPSVINATEASPEAAASSLDGNLLAEELGNLIEPWQSTLVYGPGWLHIVYRVERPQIGFSAGTLSTGQDIPSGFDYDTWYQLDASGEVAAVVNQMLDLDGNIVQVSIYKDGAWQNLTLGEDPYQGTAIVALDFGFIRDLGMASNYGTHLARQESMSPDGHTIVTFELRDTFTPPQRFDGDSTEVAAISKSVSVDATTGQIVGGDQFNTLANGDVQLTEHAEYITTEHVSEAPTTIVDYLRAR